ncbi:ubiquitin-related domain-containing protein, partial [Irpex lacteus]
NIPDSYFTPTPADLKAAQESLTARTQSLVNAPLRTQAMRDEEQKAKAAKYPTATIRVRFPDRTQLEKTFSSSEKIRSVYAFVRGSLREDVKSIKFVLYQTPPKRELKVSDLKVRDQTLLQLQLAPTAILHLKFEDESLNHVNSPAPLAQSFLAVAEDPPRPPVIEEPATAATPAGQLRQRRHPVLHQAKGQRRYQSG